MNFPQSTIRLALEYAAQEIEKDPRVGLCGAVSIACHRLETIRANGSDLHDVVMRHVDRARDRFAIEAALQLLPAEQPDSKGA